MNYEKINSLSLSLSLLKNKIKQNKEKVIILLLSVFIPVLFVSTITYGATTIGSNINTGGTLTVTGANTLYGATSVGGALTATSTLNVTGLTTLGNATTSLLTVSNGAWFTNGNIGISTTSPWGLLSINPNGIFGPSFVVGSSTATNFVITNSGNVGIGTSSPGSLFSLNNIANFTTATSSFYGQGINLTNGCFSVNGTCVGAGGGTINSGTTGQLSYYAGSGTTLTATSSLFIHSNQNVGIGTTSPFALLSVAGSGFFNSSLTASNITATGTLTVQSTTATSTFGTGGLTVGTSQFVVQQSSGNVGIGTAAPASKLYVNGGKIRLSNIADQTPFEILSYNNSESLWLNSGHATVSEVVLSPNYALDYDYGLSLQYTPGTVGAVGGRFIIGQINKSNANYTHGITSLYTNGTERVRITSAGKVGIGTTTPTTMFQVATSTANATTTIEVGKANQNKGSCLKLYDSVGTMYYCRIDGGTFTCNTTSCE